MVCFIVLCYGCKKQCNQCDQIDAMSVEVVVPPPPPPPRATQNVYSTTPIITSSGNQTNLGYTGYNTNVNLERQFSLPTYEQAIKTK